MWCHFARYDHFSSNRFLPRFQTDFSLEQCTICQLYFVPNSNETVYRLRHNNKLNVFCSQSCVATNTSRWICAQCAAKENPASICLNGWLMICSSITVLCIAWKSSIVPANSSRHTSRLSYPIKCHSHIVECMVKCPQRGFCAALATFLINYLFIPLNWFDKTFFCGIIIAFLWLEIALLAK